MASQTQLTWVWVSSGSWWPTGKPGMIQSMGLQRVRHDWTTELNWKRFRMENSTGFVGSLQKHCDLTYPNKRFLHQKFAKTNLAPPHLVFKNILLKAFREFKVWGVVMNNFFPYTYKYLLIFFPGKFDGQRSLAGCSPWGHRESGITKQLSVCMHAHTHTDTHTTSLLVWPCSKPFSALDANVSELFALTMYGHTNLCSVTFWVSALTLTFPVTWSKLHNLIAAGSSSKK